MAVSAIENVHLADGTTTTKFRAENTGEIGTDPYFSE